MVALPKHTKYLKTEISLAKTGGDLYTRSMKKMDYKSKSSIPNHFFTHDDLLCTTL